jgi:hypothetical protein
MHLTNNSYTHRLSPHQKLTKGEALARTSPCEDPMVRKMLQIAFPPNKVNVTFTSLLLHMFIFLQCFTYNVYTAIHPNV